MHTHGACVRVVVCLFVLLIIHTYISISDMYRCQCQLAIANNVRNARKTRWTFCMICKSVIIINTYSYFICHLPTFSVGSTINIE